MLMRELTLSVAGMRIAVTCGFPGSSGRLKTWMWLTSLEFLVDPPPLLEIVEEQGGFRLRSGRLLFL